MTYCVGLLVEEGLALIADTRTNAGVDDIAVYRKLHIFDLKGGGTIAIATSGNLSVTQNALSLLREGLKNPETGEVETLDIQPSLFRAAKLVGEAVRRVRHELAPSMEAESVNYDVTLLLGGRLGNGPLGLYLIYGAGNFIEASPETPFLQIGETKYGKPVLDRAVTYKTSLAETVKTALVSFDSTMRSNLGVGLPFDVLVMPRDPEAPQIRKRIEADDAYFRAIGQQWGAALKAALAEIPPPPCLS